MKSGNLSKFLKGFDTPRGTVNTKFLPQFLIIKLQAPINLIGAYFFKKYLIKLFYERSNFKKSKYDF